LTTVVKAKQETIVRWDQEERIAHLWTAYEPDARRWQKAGYEVQVYTTDCDGRLTSWSGRVPVEAIRWRRVKNGQVVRRSGHRRGRLLGVRDDELVGAGA
jgi:hypothetical protein